MAELSFIVKCNNNSEKAGITINSIIERFLSIIDIEIILVCESADIHGLLEYDEAHPDIILIVDCGKNMPEDFFETGLSHASGKCFWKIEAGETVTEEGIDSILFDTSLTNEDEFRYLCCKYRYIIQSGSDAYFPFTSDNSFPCLTDYRENAGNIDLHYFFQDILDLGRYGDPVDNNAWKKALAQYSRVISPYGTLYLSVPVGNTEKLMFNAHRIFDPITIINNLEDTLKLQEFTFFHLGNRTTYDFSMSKDRDEQHRALTYIRDNLLGDYDCGIFIFKKETKG